MKEAVHLSAERFDEVTSKGVCLVDFWADYCGPCKMLAPILDQVAAEVGDKVLIAKANVAELPEQCVQFGVRNVPDMVILRDGKIVGRLTGMQTKAKILDAIAKA